VIDLPNLTSFLDSLAFSWSAAVVLRLDFEVSLFFSSTFSSSDFFSKGFYGISTFLTFERSRSTFAYGSLATPSMPPPKPPAEKPPDPDMKPPEPVPKEPTPVPKLAPG
jgi:hypothetical protein